MPHRKLISPVSPTWHLAKKLNTNRYTVLFLESCKSFRNENFYNETFWVWFSNIVILLWFISTMLIFGLWIFYKLQSESSKALNLSNIGRYTCSKYFSDNITLVDIFLKTHRFSIFVWSNTMGLFWFTNGLWKGQFTFSALWNVPCPEGWTQRCRILCFFLLRKC